MLIFVFLLFCIHSRSEKQQDTAAVLLLQRAQQLFAGVKIEKYKTFQNWLIWVCLLGATPNGPRKGNCNILLIDLDICACYLKNTAFTILCEEL